MEARVIVKKVRSARKDFGSRGAEFRTSGIYAVTIDGMPIGEIINNSHGGYMDIGSWNLYAKTDTGCYIALAATSPTLKKLKAFIQNNPDLIVGRLSKAVGELGTERNP